MQKLNEATYQFITLNDIQDRTHPLPYFRINTLPQWGSRHRHRSPPLSLYYRELSFPKSTSSYYDRRRGEWLGCWRVGRGQRRGDGLKKREGRV